MTSTSFFSLRRLFDSMFCIIVMLEKSFWLKKEVLSQDLTVHDSMHWSINVAKLWMWRKTAPTHVSTSMLYCGDGVVSVVLGFIQPQHHLLIHCYWSSPLTSFSLVPFHLLSLVFMSPLLVSSQISLFSLLSSSLFPLLSSSSLPAASIISIKHWGDGHLLDMSVDLHIQ